MMKIAVITSVHRVDDMRIFWKEAYSISSFYKTTIYGFRGPELYLNDNLSTKVLPSPIGRIRRIIIGPKRLFSYVIKDKPDIIHIHDPELALIALFARKKHKIPVIFDNHENYPEVMLSKHWLPKIIRPFFKTFFSWLEKYLSRNFDAIITPTDSLGRKFQKMGSYVCVVKNYPSLEFFSKFLISTKKITDVIHIGMISELRANTFLKLIELTSILRPCTTWRFVGLPKRIIDYFISNLDDEILPYVELKTSLPPEKIPTQLAECKVGINFHQNILQFQTAIPVKVLEYMAAGLPTVSTPIVELNSDLPPSSARSAGLYYSSQNLEEFVQELVNLLNYRDEFLEKIGQKSKLKVKECLSWKSQADKLLEVYQRILKS